MKKRSWFLSSMLVVSFVLCSLAAFAEEEEKPAAPAPTNANIAVDINKPDLLIVSQSLSQLSKDALKIPLLRDLLTEEFAFYYEHKNEGVVSLAGAMKRIAFEHEMTGLDRFMAYVFDSPVEAAFWKGYDGKLNQFVLVMDRTLLKNALEKVAKAAAEDTQLKALANRSLGGETAQVYQVQLTGKSAYFAVTANKFFLFSKENMPLPVLGEKKWAETLTALFGLKKEVGFFGKLLGKSSEAVSTSAKHSLLFSARFLSFGYAALFPSFRSLGLSFTDKAGWSSSVLVDGEKSKDAALGSPWAFTPKSPSLCVSLPVSPAAAASYFGKLEAKTAATGNKVLGDLATSIGVCWYSESRVFTPLFIAGLKGKSGLKPADWQAAFQRIVGAEEMKKKRLEKVALKQDGALTVLTADVGSRYGTIPAAKSANGKLLASKKFFPVTLVIGESAVAFSPDAALAQAAAATIGKRAPSLEETLGGGKKASVVASPNSLAKLVRTGILDALPASQESLFRASVASFLLPSLDKMKSHPDYSAALDWSGSGEHWESLEWRSVH